MFSDNYIDTDCYNAMNCGIPACDAKFNVGPIGVFKDLGAVKWWQLFQVKKALNLSFNQNVNSEEYWEVGGGCYPRVKITPGTWGFSGNLYYCKDDIAQCRLCRVGNCLSWCYVPCGDDQNYDTDMHDPDPNDPDAPVFGDPVGNGDPTQFGLAVITECTEEVSPPDWIRLSFTARGVGQRYYFNYCESLLGFDEDFIPDGAEPGQAIPFRDSSGRVIQPGTRQPLEPAIPFIDASAQRAPNRNSDLILPEHIQRERMAA